MTMNYRNEVVEHNFEIAKCICILNINIMCYLYKRIYRFLVLWCPQPVSYRFFLD